LHSVPLFFERCPAVQGEYKNIPARRCCVWQCGRHPHDD
jgi:hypothetical protein